MAEKKQYLCKWCDSAFMSGRSDAKFCSPDCREQSHIHTLNTKEKKKRKAANRNAAMRYNTVIPRWPEKKLWVDL